MLLRRLRATPHDRSLNGVGVERAAPQLLAQSVKVPADGRDDPLACSTNLGDDRINPRGLQIFKGHRHAIPLP
jgi:hypothetical protein